MSRTPKLDLPPPLKKILKIIGLNIKSLRKEKEISQIDLAHRANISPTTLNEIESRCHRDIRLSTLVAIAQSLNVSTLELFVEGDLKLSRSDMDQLLQAGETIRRLTLKNNK